MINNKPVIAMVCTFAEREGNIHLSQQSAGRDYCLNVINCGAIPVLVPSTDNVEYLKEYAEMCDGLFLMGGEDVDPALYNQERSEKCGRSNALRDMTEMKLLELFEAKKKPVFGICRGHQIINVFYGGTLMQDIKTASEDYMFHFELPNMEHRPQPVHEVNVEPGSTLHEIFGKDVISVNSFHHQAIDRVAPGFHVMGRATDSIIEAIESDDKRIFSVQWHPENMTWDYPEFLGLFKHFMELCVNE